MNCKKIFSFGLMVTFVLQSSILSAQDSLPLEPTRKVSFVTDEGSGMSVDVSPDGKTIVFNMLGDLYTLGIKGGRAKRITSGMAYDTHPVYSPDGKKIAFTSDRSGSHNLWVINVDGSNPRNISRSNRAALMHSPAWSPDGLYLYVTRAHNVKDKYRVWMHHINGGDGIPLTGSGPETAEYNEIGPAPSPDGNYIYYAHGIGWKWWVQNPFWDISTWNTKTGEIEKVLDEPLGVMNPEISPSGQFLAYMTRFGTQIELRLRNLETGEDRQLFYPIEGDNQGTIAYNGLMPEYDFTPDGNEIVFTDRGKIKKVEVATGNATIIPFTAEVNLDLGPDLNVELTDPKGPVQARIIQTPQFSPDGKTLAFTAFGKLYTMPASGGAPKRLTNTPLERGNVTEHQASWSPDGRWLTYVTWKKGEGHIWKVRANGKGKPKRLTETSAFFRNPTFTPNGKSIIALRSSAYDRERSYRGNYEYLLTPQDIVRLSSDGGRPQLIKQMGGNNRGIAGMYITDRGGFHFINNDDKHVYLYTEKGLLKISLDDGGLQTIAQVISPGPNQYFIQKERATGTQLSPDGKWLLVLDNQQLYLAAMPSTGSKAFVLDLTKPTMALKRLTDIGADYFSWIDGGKTITWSIGSSVYQIPFEGISFIEDKDRDTIAEDKIKPLHVAVSLPRDIPAGTIVLRGATTLTMRGDEVIQNADIVIERNRIKAVGARGKVAIPVGAKIRDLSGKYITPGFIDTHLHRIERTQLLDYETWGFPLNLAYGVTAGIDPAAKVDSFIYQDLIDAGVIIGQRAYSTGPYIISNRIRNVSEQQALALVRRYKEHYRTGNIKIYMGIDRLTRQYLAVAAKKLGVMQTTETGDLMFNPTYAIDGLTAIEHSQSPAYKDVIELYRQSNIGYSPTVLTYNGGGLNGSYYFFATQNPLNDSKLKRFVPQNILANILRRWPSGGHESEYIFDQYAATATKIFRTTGKVSTGTHGFDGNSNLAGLGVHWEIQAMTMGGATAHEALQMATIGGAKVIGRATELGSLEPNKYADLIIFDKNPLENIRNTESISQVMKNGRLYNGDDLSEIRTK